MSILLDAGPTLNFLAVSKHSLLVAIAERGGLELATPQRVSTEILGKARSDSRFRRTPASATWHKLTSAGRVTVLPDELTDPLLVDAVARVSGMNAVQRARERKSLGEIMTLAHASVLAQRGRSVYVLIDESDGRRRGQRESEWLARSNAVGSLRLWHTRQVLENADEAGLLPEGWRAVYLKMRPFDDGLPPL